jgi:hypothetical protein
MTHMSTEAAWGNDVREAIDGRLQPHKCVVTDKRIDLFAGRLFVYVAHKLGSVDREGKGLGFRHSAA